MGDTLDDEPPGRVVNAEVASCCFCYEGVPWYRRVDLVVVPVPDGDEQQHLICHRQCLVSLVDARVPLHPDLATEESVTSASERYDDLNGLARGLLIALADQLPATTVGVVDELLDANELGVAVEIMSEMLVVSNARLDAECIAMFQRAVGNMDLDRAIVDRLRPLVEDLVDYPGDSTSPGGALGP